jgi:hypothetical protein
MSAMVDTSPTVEPRAKGINFRSFVGAARRILGKPAVEKIAAVVPAELGKMILRDGWVTNNWYPLADFRRLHGAAQQVSGRGLDLTWELARDAALDDFRGIYRVLTFVLSPEFLIKRTPAIWSRYYDVGTVSVEAKARTALARFADARGFDRVLWQDVIGGCVGVLEVCGAKQVKTTVIAGGGDEDNLALAAEWK